MQGCKFHRIVASCFCQTGDIIDGTGTGGESIYGLTMEDETFELGHTLPGARVPFLRPLALTLTLPMSTYPDSAPAPVPLIPRLTPPPPGTQPGPGLLSMANSGPNTSNSQFSIITFPQPQLDGKHVVFGQLVRGFTTLTMIEAAYDPSSGVLGTPMQEVVITACGELTPIDD